MMIMSALGMSWLLMGLLAVLWGNGVEPSKLLSSISKARSVGAMTATATRSVTVTKRSTVFKKNCWTETAAASASSSSASSAAGTCDLALNTLQMCHELGYNVEGLYVVPEFSRLLHALNVEQRALAARAAYPRDYSLSVRAGDEFDVVIVGSGAAGSVLAAKLSDEKDVRVLLLEAGGVPSLESEVPGLWANSIGTAAMDWNYAAEPDDTYGQGLVGRAVRVVRGRTLGGTTALNTMLYDRGVDADYTRFEAAGLRRWSWKDVVRYYKRSEDCRYEKIVTSETVSRSHGCGGRVRVDSFRNTRTVEIRRVFATALRAVDYDTPDFFSVKEHRGFASSVATVKDGLRVNVARAFLQNADRKYNLKIAARSLVTRVTFDGDRASGVEFVNSVGETVAVRAKRSVVLSAGPVGSPALLMRSGVGPRAAIEQLRVPVVADSPRVGANLQAHPTFLGLVVKYDGQPLKSYSVSEMVFEYLTKHAGPMANIGLGSFTGFIDVDGNGVPDVQIFFNYYSEDDTVFMPSQLDAFNFDDAVSEQLVDLNDDNDVQLVGVSLLRPKNTGRVTLRQPPAAAGGACPSFEPSVRYGSLHQDDVATLLQAVDWVKKLVLSEAFKRYGPTIVPLKLADGPEPDVDSEDYWRHAIKHLTTMNVQMAGTCAMAAQKSGGVVDEDLNVYGVRGLKVVDSSALPNLFSAESCAPTMMVAEKASDIIKRELGCQVDDDDDESAEESA